MSIHGKVCSLNSIFLSYHTLRIFFLRDCSVQKFTLMITLDFYIKGKFMLLATDKAFLLFRITLVTATFCLNFSLSTMKQVFNF